MEFIAWPKTPRFQNNEVIITEKIDGTNAQICIGDNGEFFVGSRTKWITPEQDNYGFAKWAYEHKEELLSLGRGRHYGEWWGSGIQRGYNQTEKKFSLFNTFRPIETLPSCVGQVPILYSGEFDTNKLYEVIEQLKKEGSRLSPGYMNVEGVCLYFTQSKNIVKYIINK